MNSLALAGRLAKDPWTGVTKTTGKPLATITLAVDGGKDKTLFIPAFTMNEKTVNFLRDYCHKGDAVAITGEINTKEEQAGQYKKTILSVSFFRLDKLSSKQQAGQESNSKEQPQGFDTGIKQMVTPDDLPF